MCEQQQGRRYLTAKAEADKTEEEIITALQEGYSFRVEAGAGSGKTYSLNKVVEWLQSNRREEFQRKKQQVICITYTNAAVAVIEERLIDKNFIVPSTIHSFAWSAIKQYQSTLLSILEQDERYDANPKDSLEAFEVTYELGQRYREGGVQYLHHNDVLDLFAAMLGFPKFRRVFASKYPIVLIDEYQDSYEPIIDRFRTHFIDKKCGPQFGFFGDSWQTIYQSGHACGWFESQHLKHIGKRANFRSAPRVVEVLNRLRPELSQLSAIDDAEGEVVVVTCDDYQGRRDPRNYYKGDLPGEELKARVVNLLAHVRQSLPEGETLKTLMLTHRLLARQQGYDALFDVIPDGFKEKNDPVLMFLLNVVEPLCEGLERSDMSLVCGALGRKQYPVKKKLDKLRWQRLAQLLARRDEKRCIDVLEALIDSQVVPVPASVRGWCELYMSEPDVEYGKATLGKFLELDYSQFRAGIQFLSTEAEFSTEHGVKGEEYDHVIFTISKGWNEYQYEKFAPLITKPEPVPAEKQQEYERNRNLFYVCCSRAKKRLIIFVSLEIDWEFRQFLKNLVGSENVCSYSEFLAR